MKDHKYGWLIYLILTPIVLGAYEGLTNVYQTSLKYPIVFVGEMESYNKIDSYSGEVTFTNTTPLNKASIDRSYTLTGDTYTGSLSYFTRIKAGQRFIIMAEANGSRHWERFPITTKTPRDDELRLLASVPEIQRHFKNYPLEYPMYQYQDTTYRFESVINPRQSIDEAGLRRDIYDQLFEQYILSEIDQFKEGQQPIKDFTTHCGGWAGFEGDRLLEASYILTIVNPFQRGWEKKLGLGFEKFLQQKIRFKDKELKISMEYFAKGLALSHTTWNAFSEFMSVNSGGRFLRNSNCSPNFEDVE